LFGDTPSLNVSQKIKLISATAATRQERLAWEKELLGLYITEHPFSDFREQLKDIALSTAEVASHLGDSQVVVSGVIVKIQKINTRSNETMLFVKIEDIAGSIELLVFPSLLKETPAVWQDGKVVLCQGKLSNKDKDIKLLCNKATILDLGSIDEQIVVFKKIMGSVNSAKRNSFYKNGNGGDLSSFTKKKTNLLKLILPHGLQAEEIIELKKILAQNQGSDQVYFSIRQNSGYKTVATGLTVKKSQDLNKQIEEIFKDKIIIGKDY
jgi:DNA polymerase-3 subunit alpha